jgi:phosphoserine aminotransferase
MKVHNFNAGPAILPQEVVQEAAKAVLDFNNSGMGILEISHRSKDFMAVMDEAQALVKELCGLGDEYKVLFLQGGASSQFMMIPYNLLASEGSASYLDTGVWANKALKEAKNFGSVNVVASSKDANYSFIPKEFTIPADAAYFHITTNNTIYGTQLQTLPKCNTLYVADMSSDFLSRRHDFSQFDLIYAGAQKNLGPAGATIVIIKESILGKMTRVIPTMLDYRTHIKEGSMFNTPPVFSTYVCMLTLRWIKKHGLETIEKMNLAKANLLYNEIDRNPLFKGTVAVEDRSWMNVNFVTNDPAHEEGFKKLAKEHNLIGLAGHRSVGGFRASLYNALTLESVQALVDAMQAFEKANS